MPFIFEKPIFLFLLLLIPIVWITLYRSVPDHALRRSQMRVGIMRSLLIMLLSLALSDPRLLKSSDRVNIFFCMDISESIDRTLNKKGADFMKNTVKGMREDDQAGLILFGKEPAVEHSLTTHYEHPVYRSIVNKNFTNIYAALKLAIGKLPRTGKNRIVLLTDGNENMDQALDMVSLAKAMGIEIFPISLFSKHSSSEIFVETLETPPHVSLNTPFEIRLVLVSTGETNGDLTIQRNDTLILNKSIRLEPGKNMFRFSDTLEKQGLYRYKAVINGTEDGFFQNNQGISFTHTAKRPAILYVTGNSDKQRPPILALKAQGFDIIHERPEAIPTSIHDLVDYTAVILDNVPADTLTFGIMDNLEQYVRDMGGGLVMIGGDQSFGAGHYLKTPVEKALPVFMDVPTDLEVGGICIILIIDKSHSMVGSYANKTKLEMAKIAAFSTVELLNPIDSVGILAFDSNFRWIVPPGRIKDRQQIAQKLSALKEEGGTDLYPALKDAFRVLGDYEAVKKHMIILSDGQTNEADFQPLVASIRRAGITISTVAVGINADLILMRDIAQWSDGRAYYTDNPEHIPNIFIDETKIVTQKVILEKNMHPKVVTQSNLLQGIPQDNLPMVYGHVLTYPKPDANVVIQTSEGPLLVTGQYGLGRSVAFTSDLSGRWGKDWVKWDHYNQFFSQMIKWAQKKETPRKYTTTITGKGVNGDFLVDVMDERNRFLNNLTLHVQVIFPDETSKEITLDQIAPGRYRTTFPTENAGEYYLNLVEKDETGPVSSQVFGFGIPYGEEFRIKGVNDNLLKQLAQMTGGELLQVDEDHKELFSTDSGTKEYGAHLWPYLTGLFVLLLIVDAAMRKFMGRVSLH